MKNVENLKVVVVAASYFSEVCWFQIFWSYKNSNHHIFHILFFFEQERGSIMFENEIYYWPLFCIFCLTFAHIYVDVSIAQNMKNMKPSYIYAKFDVNTPTIIELLCSYEGHWLRVNRKHQFIIEKLNLNENFWSWLFSGVHSFHNRRLISHYIFSPVVKCAVVSLSH